jgi:citronellol/citronellal dehydrogenase
VVVITGGGTGIGKAVAEEIGKLGGKIAICGRREEPLQATAAELKVSVLHRISNTISIIK